MVANPEIFFSIFVCICIAVILHSKSTPKKKPKTLNEIAEKLGIQIRTTDGDKLLHEYNFLNELHYGKKQHMLHVLEGEFQGEQVSVFEMRYETMDMGKGGPLDIYSFYVLDLPLQFPEVTIYKEGLISKIVQATGHNDIDFESHEFSRRFRVRSASPKFAYDFCHARMEEYLLANRDLSVEIENSTLCISFERPLIPEEIEPNLNRLLKIRALMPDYLFTA